MKTIVLFIIIAIISVEGYAQLSRKPMTAEYINQDLCVINSTAYLWYTRNKQGSDYQAIYFDKKNMKYYGVTNIQETNNIYYTYDEEKAKKKEQPTWQKSGLAKYEIRLLYVGNISKLERIYIDTNDNKQYLKVLIPIKSGNYTDIFYKNK